MKVDWLGRPGPTPSLRRTEDCAPLTAAQIDIQSIL